jgi:arginase
MDTPIEMFGVPMDLGADRRGVDMGPSAIRYGGLYDEIESIGRQISDEGDLTVPNAQDIDPEAGDHLGGDAKYVEEIRAACETIATKVREIRAADRFPLVLGGDHAISMGTATGCAYDASTGVIWFDAHADLNTPETTPSGNVHGMPLAAILGRGVFAESEWGTAPTVDPANVAIVGLRSVDKGEREYINNSDINAYTMTDIDEFGMTEITRQAIEDTTADTDQLFISLDMDMLTPDEAPGVGTPVHGGVSYREAHAAMELVYRQTADVLCGLDVVEVNPILDRENRTAELACELVASAFGKRIL